MEQLLMQLLEEAKKDRQKLSQIKVLAAKCKNFVLAGEIYNLEKQLFPESEETKKAKIKGEELSSLLRIIDLNFSDKYAWLINETIKKYNKRNGNFDLKDAAALKIKMIEHFGEE